VGGGRLDDDGIGQALGKVEVALPEALVGDVGAELPPPSGGIVSSSTTTTSGAGQARPRTILRSLPSARAGLAGGSR